MLIITLGHLGDAARVGDLVLPSPAAKRAERTSRLVRAALLPDRLVHPPLGFVPRARLLAASLLLALVTPAAALEAFFIRPDVLLLLCWALEVARRLAEGERLGEMSKVDGFDMEEPPLVKRVCRVCADVRCECFTCECCVLWLVMSMPNPPCRQSRPSAPVRSGRPSLWPRTRAPGRQTQT